MLLFCYQKKTIYYFARYRFCDWFALNHYIPQPTWIFSSLFPLILGSTQSLLPNKNFTVSMYIRFIILLLQLQISLFQKPFYTNRRLLSTTIINRVFWRCVQIKSEKIKLQIYVLCSCCLFIPFSNQKWPIYECISRQSLEKSGTLGTLKIWFVDKVVIICHVLHW